MKAAYAGNLLYCRCVHRGQFQGLERELPDGDHRADDQEWIDYHLEYVAAFFFRAHQKRVGRFVLVL